MLFTNTQQSFKFSSFIKRRRGGEKGKRKQPNEPNKKEKKTLKNKNKTETKQTQINNTTVSLQRRQRVDIFTHVCSMYINYRGGDARGRGHMCVCAWPHPAPNIHAHRHARPHARPTLTHPHAQPHAQTRLPGSRRREAGITSPRPPLCNNQGRYHQTGRGRGTSAASLWRRRGRWSRIPSSLSSFSVFGLQDPLVTVQWGCAGSSEPGRDCRRCRGSASGVEGS